MDDTVEVTRVDRADGGIGLLVAGDVDLASSAVLADAIREAVVTRPGTLTVHLGRVTFLDSTGIRTLLLGRDLASEHDVVFRITAPQPLVRRVLHLAGVLDLLTDG